MVNAHAGPLTGEDGPTHACPQALQLLQDNFPKGSMITLTPWDTQEVWPLLMASLRARPAVLAPFVTRPACPVLDRAKLGLPPASAATKGVYAVRRGGKATVVLQGHGVAHFFMRDVLPKLDAAGVKLNVFYVTSAELFDRLSDAEKGEVFPPEMAFSSMGITDFTLATLWRWVRSDAGLAASLYPLKQGYLGSGSGDKVFEQALDKKIGGQSELEQVRSPLKFSAHATQRLRDRKITLDAAMMAKVNDAVDKADAKGLDDALVLTKDAALIVSVRNRTVITAIDNNSLSGNVFTNIDGAVIV